MLPCRELARIGINVRVPFIHVLTFTVTPNFMISIFAALYVRCFEAVVSQLNPALPKFFVIKKLVALAMRPFQVAPRDTDLEAHKAAQQDPCSAARNEHLQRASMTHHESMLLPEKVSHQLTSDQIAVPGLRRRPRTNKHDLASFIMPTALSD